MAPPAWHDLGRLAVGRRAFLLGLTLSPIACRRSPPKELLVLGAASLSDALREAGGERQGDFSLRYGFGASGDLARQLIAAPRADLFVSASSAWMDRAQAAGRIDRATRRDLLSNRLVVIAHPQASYVLHRSRDLARLDFRALAIGQPDAVPAGAYAKEWLQGVRVGDHSLWQLVGPRLHPSGDVRAALAQVARRRDCIGIVYRSDALAETRVRVLFPVPSAETPPIRYPAALVAGRPHAAAAGALLERLSSAAAARVFARHGFVPLGGAS